MSDITEDVVQAGLMRELSHPVKIRNTKSIVQNGSEADLLMITDSNYVWEIEIKTSKQDLINEIELMKSKKVSWAGTPKHSKTLKHKIMNAFYTGNNPFKGTRYQLTENKCPNKFFIAVPDDVEYKNLIPDYWGVFVHHVDDYNWCNIEKVKKGEFIHKKDIVGGRWKEIAKYISGYYERRVIRKQRENIRDFKLHREETNDE